MYSKTQFYPGNTKTDESRLSMKAMILLWLPIEELIRTRRPWFFC